MTEKLFLFCCWPKNLYQRRRSQELPIQIKLNNQYLQQSKLLKNIYQFHLKLKKKAIMPYLKIQKRNTSASSQYIQFSSLKRCFIVIIIILIYKVKKNSQYKNKMMELQAHSKHIKLLSDYNAALEKQLQAKKNQIQYIKEVCNFTAIEQSNRIIDDYRIYRVQNIQQRKEISNLKSQLKRLYSIENQCSVLNKQLQGERGERLKTHSNIENLKKINKQLYQIIFKEGQEAHINKQQFDHYKYALLQQNIALKLNPIPHQHQNRLKDISEQTQPLQSNESRINNDNSKELQLLKIQENKYRQITTQNQRLIIEIQIKNSELSLLKQEIKITLDELNSKRSQLTSITDKYREKAEQQLKLQNQLKSMKFIQNISEASIKSERTLFNEQLGQMMNKIPFLQEENDKLIVEIDRLKNIQCQWMKEKDNVSELVQKNRILVKQIQDLRVDIVNKDQRNEHLQSCIQDIEAKNKRQEFINQQSKIEIGGKKDDEILSLKNSLLKIKEENQILQKDFGQLKQQLASRQQVFRNQIEKKGKDNNMTHQKSSQSINQQGLILIDRYASLQINKQTLLLLNNRIVEKDNMIDYLEESNSVLRKQLVANLIKEEAEVKKMMLSKSREKQTFPRNNGKEKSRFLEGKSTINRQELKKSYIFSERSSDFHENTQDNTFSQILLQNEKQCNIIGCQTYDDSQQFEHQKTANDPIQQISF